MTEGTSQGLFIVVAIVIFGIFVGLSYTLFGDVLQPQLKSIFETSLTGATNKLMHAEENPEYVITEETDAFEKGYIVLTDENEGQAYTYYLDKAAQNVIIVSSGKITADERNVTLDEGANLTGKIHFPDKIRGLNVVAIGVNPIDWSASNGFVNAKFTGTIKLPAELTIIPDNLFNASRFRGSLTIPNKVTYIGNQSFINSTFSGDLVIPDSVVTIGTQAFNSSNFKGSLKLGNNLENIGDRAFMNSEFTGKLVLPNKLNTIGTASFYSSKFKGDLVFGDNLEYVGSESFSWTKFDGTLTLNEKLKRISNKAFLDSAFTKVIDNSSSTSVIEADSIKQADGTFYTK